MRDQRAKRFDSRRDLHLQSQGLHDWKKMPTDSAKVEVNSGALSVVAPTRDNGSNADGASTALPAGSAIEVAPVHDDDLDIENLDLGPRAAAHPKAKAKLKRTRAEINKDECQKLRKELDGVVKDLATLPHTPKVVDLGRIERMLTKRVKDFKEASDFESATEMSKYVTELEVIRNLVKPSQSFLTGSANTRKKNEKDRPTREHDELPTTG